MNKTKFVIHCLNQEKILNELSKFTTIEKVVRSSKTDTVFLCQTSEFKNVKKFLEDRNVEILEISHFGLKKILQKFSTSVGGIVAFAIFFVAFVIQCNFLWRFDISGLETIKKAEITAFIDKNFSKTVKIDTKALEIALANQFPRISFVSCIVKGQTLVINIKEKLIPEELEGNFSPIVASKSGKIVKIDIVSGTAKVKVGDFVKAGQVLVEPFVEDSSGKILSVEAEAEILAEVYSIGTAEHCERKIEINRTGKTCERCDVMLFGLNIYTFADENNFSMFETEVEEIDMVKNLVLPFKIKKTTFFELEEKIIESKFEDVKDEYVQKARQKALEIIENCDTIKEEFYTFRHVSGVTVVSYCITTEEEIGADYAN